MSMSAHASIVPPEVVYTIIDHLHADRHSLAVCGMVCKAWIPPSRYYLFSTVKLLPRTTKCFLKLLESYHTTILPYVRRLEIDQIESSRSSRALWMSARALMPHLTPLISVASLHLSNIYRGQIGNARVTIFASTFRNIKELELEKVDFNDSNHLINFLCDFRVLERVSLDVHLLDNKAPPHSGRHKISPFLRALRLVVDAEGPGADIFRWLALHNPPPAIHNLVLHTLMTLELSAAGHFVRALGNNLHNLAISLFFYSSSPVTAAEICRHIDLSHNHNLRSVEFLHVGLTRLCPSTVQNQCIPIILSEISSLIEELRFNIYITVIDELNDFDWGTMSRVLARPQLSTLREIHFIVWYPGPMGARVEDVIKRKLPECYARGILRITVLRP